MNNGQLYTGYTHNLKQRITEHKSGGVITTSKYLPLRLIFYESFLDKKDAQRREEYLKTTKGKTTLRLMLRESLKL